jgi:membrane associated rhomboid family serine protease
VLTLIVFAVTAAVNVAQLVYHPLLGELERSPAALHGDWWRTSTALLVQDGGVAGTVSNLLFLLLLGTLAEQVVSREGWLAAYLTTALIGELAGVWWQPTGGGNSVAICGLAGAILAAMGRDDPVLPGMAPFLAVLWIGVLLATAWFPLVIVGLVAAFVLQRLWVAGGRARRAAALAAVVFTAVVGGFLAMQHNIHGPAALIGLSIGPLVGLSPAGQTRPAPPQQIG